MDFVWPYIKDPSFFNKGGIFNELKYSIDTVKKYYRGDVRCFVVGDDPKLDVEWIPCKRVVHGNIPWERHVDQLEKFRATVDSEVNDDFVWIYDDTLFLQPVTEEMITQTYGYNRVEDVDKYIRKWSRTYALIWKNTYRIIRDFKDELYDWETHLPRYLNKEKLMRIIENYDLHNNNLITTSLYHAHYEEGTVLMKDLQYDLISWPPKVTLKEGFERPFLNLMDQAITFEFIDYLNAHLST